MSLRARLKSIGLAAALATGAMSGAQAAETQETEVTPTGICHWEAGTDKSDGHHFWIDDTIEGVQVASMKDLRTLGQEQSWEDVLDPERKYRSDTSPDVIEFGRQLNDGLVMSSNQLYTNGSASDGVRQTFKKASIHGEAHAIDGNEGAVAGFTHLQVGEETTPDGSSRITDSSTTCNFHLKTQTDRLLVQQWYQDSMNVVLKSDATREQKDKALDLLVSGMGATMSPMLDHVLPNPDQVQALSGDMQLPRKVLEDAQKTGKAVQFDGLQPTKSGKADTKILAQLQEVSR